MKKEDIIVLLILIIAAFAFTLSQIKEEERPIRLSSEGCQNIGDTCGNDKTELQDELNTSIWKMTDCAIPQYSDNDGADCKFSYFIINPFTEKGDKIVYEEEWNPGPDKIMVLNVSNGDILLVSDPNNNGDLLYYPAISPDGNKVFFVKQVYVNSEWFENIIMTDLSQQPLQETQITSYCTPGNICNESGWFDIEKIAVNSDNTKVLWRVSNTSEYQKFVLYDIEEETLETILEEHKETNIGYWKNYAFSPTNPSIFFFGAENDSERIYNFETEETFVLDNITDGTYIKEPSHCNWRGDGQRIICEPQGDQIRDYWLYYLNGSLEGPVGCPDNEADTLGHHPVYHPTDNNIIATAGNTPHLEKDIFCIINETRLLEVVNYNQGSGRNNEIMFSPDGTKFVYENSRESGSDLREIYIGITDTIQDNGTLIFNYLKPTINLQASATETQITLTWNIHNGKEIEGYNLYKNNSSGSYNSTPINTNLIPKTTTIFTDSNVQGNITYYYVITAKEYSGLESEYSNEASSVLLEITNESECGNLICEDDEDCLICEDDCGECHQNDVEGEAESESESESEAEAESESESKSENITQELNVNLFDNTEYRVYTSLATLILTVDSINNHILEISSIGENQIVFTLDGEESTLAIGESKTFTIDGIDIEILLNSITDENAELIFKRLQESSQERAEQRSFYIGLIATIILVLTLVTLFIIKKIRIRRHQNPPSS